MTVWCASRAVQAPLRLAGRGALELPASTHAWIAGSSAAGIDWSAIAAVLDLPDADAARRRHEKHRPRKNIPVDEVDPPRLDDQ